MRQQKVRPLCNVTDRTSQWLPPAEVPADQTAQPPFIVVQNWQSGLKK
jgi:hypothetical protein